MSSVAFPTLLGGVLTSFLMGGRLKLHIYRSLGILASQDPTTGEFNRAVIRRRKISDCADGTGGSEKADVSVVNVDSKLDQGFYTGMFWDAL